jgi:23S rRNA (guanosine2251-2'-O)-methyltransferase
VARRSVARPFRRRSVPALDFDDVLYGIHAVDEALSAGEALRAVHVADDRKRDPQLRKLLERAKALNVPVRFENRTWFSRLPYKAHQGLVAIGPPFAYASLYDVLRPRADGRPHLFVVVDHVTDPHNLGAIVRTAECAGVDAVVIPERRAAGVNATVRKAAAGATEHLPVVRVANIADAIRRLKKANVWVAGADAGEGSVEMTAADLHRDLALVIGAEGEGLAALVRRECDYLVRIPLFGRVASLNASVAAAVLLYEAVRQRGCDSSP